MSDDGFSLDAVTRAGVPVTLRVRGLDGNADVPLVIEAACRACGVVLSHREYMAFDEREEGAVEQAAALDAMLATAHHCGNRN